MADAAGGFAAHTHAARSALRRFGAATCGATAIEYAMIAGFISIVIVASAAQIGGTVKSFFEEVIAPFL